MNLKCGAYPEGLSFAWMAQQTVYMSPTENYFTLEWRKGSTHKHMATSSVAEEHE